MEIATNDFVDLMSHVVACGRLRQGRGNGLSQSLRTLQANIYSECANDALNEWWDALATAESDTEDDASEALSRLRRGAHTQPDTGGVVPGGEF